MQDIYIADINEQIEIVIGKQGENLVRRIIFNISGVKQIFGDIVTRLLFKRHTDIYPYPVNITVDGNNIIWEVTNTDTQYAGNGLAELRFYSGEENERLLKSNTFRVSVISSLIMQEQEPPMPGVAWADGIIQASVNAEKAALDTALYTANIEEVEIETNTLEPGENASVVAVSEDGIKTMVFNIPRGNTGNGITSLIQTTTSTESGGNNIITVTFADNTSATFIVRNGSKGDRGDPFVVSKVYASYEEMQADFNNPILTLNSFVVISSNTEDPHNSEMYTKGENEWVFFTDLSGAQGVKGDTGNGISGFTSTQDANGNTIVTVRFTDNTETSFTVLRGIKGDTGSNGENGITFIPSVAADGTLAWVNNGNLPNPNPVNIKGPTGQNGLDGADAKINGYNTIQISQGANISLSWNGANLIISAQDTQYSNATTTASGLMSSADKNRLDNIQSGAQVNTIETVSVNGVNVTLSNKNANIIIPTKVSDLQNDSGFVNDISGKQDMLLVTGGANQPIYVSASGVVSAVTHTLDADVPSNAVFTDTTYSPATSSANGLMSAADKAKLDSVSMPVILANQSVANFTSEAAGRPIRVTANIQPVQASGTPSPENPLPITGWTGANITVSPNAQGTGGTVYTVSFPSSAGTVYGGTLDAARGLLTVTHIRFTLDPSLTPSAADYKAGYPAVWFTASSTSQFVDYPPYVHDYNSSAWYSDIMICDTIPPVDNPYNNAVTGVGFRYNHNTYAVTMCLRINGSYISGYEDTGNTSNYVSSVRQFLTDYPTHVVYKLATPLTYQLTPQQLVTLADTNNVWADCGSVTVTHWPGTGTPVEPVDMDADATQASVIADLAARVAALEA